MTRRQLFATLVAIAVIAANVAVWYARKEPDGRITDSRDVRRQQLISRWDPLPVVPFDGVVGTLSTLMEVESHLRLGRNAAGFGASAAVRDLEDAVRVDLAQAVGDALATIAGNDPEQVLRYMAARGLEPHRPSLLSSTPAGNQEDKPQRTSDPTALFKAYWERSQVDPHWAGWVPAATKLNVWKPLSLRQVSMVQLGRNESWLWGNETIFPALFRGTPAYRQVSMRKPALLADVMVLIQHDGSLGGERSPYYFRFWRSDPEQPKWQPLAIKLVRIDPADDAPPPVIAF